MTRDELQTTREELEARYRRTVEYSPVPKLLFDVMGRVLMVNGAWTALTGYAREDIPDRATWLERAFRDEADVMSITAAGLCPVVGPVAGEATLWTKQGARREVTLRSAALDPGPHDTGLHVLVAMDVTEERQTRRRMVMEHQTTRAVAFSRTFEEALPRILAESRQAIGAERGEYWAPDPGGPGYIRHMSVPDGEAPSGPTAREDLASDPGSHGAAVTVDGRCAGILVYRFDEKWPQDPMLPETLVTVALTLAGFLKRLAVEEEQRRQASEIESLYLAAPVALATLDGETRFLRVNERLGEIAGAPPATLIGKRFVDLFPDPEGTVSERLGPGLRGEATLRDEEIELIDSKGEKRICVVSFAPLPHTEEAAGRVVASMLDITDRKRVETALKDADRHKDEFIAMLGHELRNPLAALRSGTVLLKGRQLEESMFRSVTDILDRQSAHMARLVDGLLDVSRVMRGKIKIETVPLDLSAVTREALGDRRAAIRSAGLGLRRDFESPLWVMADRTRLIQIIDNLLSNAIKFTGSGGVIHVTTFLRGDRAVLHLRDTGVGIEEELMTHLFEPFRQSRQSLDRSLGGLGLGLGLVKRLVEMHGGTIRLESSGSGQGTSVTLELPLTGAPAGAAATRRVAAVPERLVLVEDNRDAGELLKTLLEAAGHTVDLHLDARSALRALAADKPDAVLCDIGLPGSMDGHAFAREIRRHPELRDLFLIALSGYGLEEDRSLAMESGFDEHLAKPADLEDIERLLERRRL